MIANEEDFRLFL